MIRKLFSFLLLICILVFVSGCSSKNKLYSLEEAYENKFITKEDLWNIAYIYNGCVNASNVEYDVKTIKDELDIKLERKIKKAYIKNDLDDIFLPKMKCISIIKYYGVYSGCHVLEMNNDCIYVDLKIYDKYEIDGIVFLSYTGYYFKVFNE
jgi:hypothetical protein